MPRQAWVRVSAGFVLLGLSVGASVVEGTLRVALSLAALALVATCTCCLPARRVQATPAVQGAIGVVSGVCILAVAFSVYLLFVLAGASTPILIAVALVLMAISALLAMRYNSTV